MLVHLAERGVLPADEMDIVNADVIKPENQFFIMLCHFLAPARILKKIS
jgi:hypothetical protein